MKRIIYTLLSKFAFIVFVLMLLFSLSSCSDDKISPNTNNYIIKEYYKQFILPNNPNISYSEFFMNNQFDEF